MAAHPHGGATICAVPTPRDPKCNGISTPMLALILKGRAFGISAEGTKIYSSFAISWRRLPRGDLSAAKWQRSKGAETNSPTSSPRTDGLNHFAQNQQQTTHSHLPQHHGRLLCSKIQYIVMELSQTYPISLPEHVFNL